MALLTRQESTGPLGKPDIQVRIEQFKQNNFSRNLRLGRLTTDEMTLVRFIALKEGLIHNIPRVMSGAPSESPSSAHPGSPLQRQQSLDLRGYFIWKPHETERDIFELLKQFVSDEWESKLQFSPDFDHRERWIAHYVADSMGLEHRSVETPQGRCLLVWKERDLFGRLSRSRSETQQKSGALGGLALRHTDTWTGNGTYRPFPALEEDAEMDVATSADNKPTAEPEDLENVWSLSSSGGGIGGIGVGSNDSGGGGGGGGDDDDDAGWKNSSSGGGTGDGEPIGESRPFSRQISDRVIQETAALQQRIQQPSQPRRITTGTGEVYEVRDGGTGERAIFKPAVQNHSTGAASASQAAEIPLPTKANGMRGDAASKSHDSKGALDDNRSAFAHRRELAAYQLDHFGFAGVLPCFISSMESRAGVIQSYLEHEQTADEDEWGRRQINALSVREVHKIGVLDLRLFNEDRHGGNLLLDFGAQHASAPHFDSSELPPPQPYSGKATSARLVPIDHEMTLPDWRQLHSATFCWLTWPQVLHGGSFLY